MYINIPTINGDQFSINDKSSIVLIGANGSGKTRLSTWIEYNNSHIKIHRISAQKPLNMPSNVRPSELTLSQENFLYGTTNENKEWLYSNGKKHSRWGNNPEIHFLNDFPQLMEFLMTEEYEKSIEFRNKHKSGNTSFDNETRLEKIKRIWENVICNKKLKVSAGKIEVTKVNSSEEYYNGSEMSDGERAIFYFIGEVLSVPENSLIIIDEPENHLHKSILIRLWNAIESEKKDSTFLYITHSLDFATSRTNSQLIWVKDIIDKNTWDYELIEENFATDALNLEILGNRQKILLIEGTPQKSIDRKLYSLLFKEYNIIPLESCNRVIQFTKAYRNLNHLHYDDVKGIIDRDRRSNEEVNNYRSEFLYCPDVSEIENLFLLPEVIMIVTRLQNQNSRYDIILSETKEKTFEFLQINIDSQALLFTRQRLTNQINDIMNKKCSNINEYKNNINDLESQLNIDVEYSKAQQELQEIINSKDYLGALKVINNKGLLPFTNLTNNFGWKKDFYISYILNILNSSSDDSKELSDILCNYIQID